MPLSIALPSHGLFFLIRKSLSFGRGPALADGRRSIRSIRRMRSFPRVADSGQG